MPIANFRFYAEHFHNVLIVFCVFVYLWSLTFYRVVRLFRFDVSTLIKGENKERGACHCFMCANSARCFRMNERERIFLLYHFLQSTVVSNIILLVLFYETPQ